MSTIPSDDTRTAPSSVSEANLSDDDGRPDAHAVSHESNSEPSVVVKEVTDAEP